MRSSVISADEYFDPTAIV